MNGQFEIGDLSPPKLFIGISAVLGLVIALIIDPPDAFISHLLHWQIQTAGAVICIIFTHIALFKLFKYQQLNPWLRVALSGLIGAIMFSPIAAISDVFFGGEILERGFKGEVINEIISVIPPMVVAWIAMNSPWLMGYRLWRSTEPIDNEMILDTNNENSNTQAEPSFLSLTKIDSASDILYIKSELHYINVVTAESKHLILFSLKEAKAQLNIAGLEGIQCHRGYWVSNKAIETIKRSGREAEFVLNNGDSIPISRANVSKCMQLLEKRHPPTF